MAPVLCMISLVYEKNMAGLPTRVEFDEGLVVDTIESLSGDCGIAQHHQIVAATLWNY